MTARRGSAPAAARSRLSGARLLGSLPRGGWLGAIRISGAALVVLLLTAALLLVAAKLHTPSLAAGWAPTSVLSAIVIVALACLGAPVRVSSVTFTGAPLGALLLGGAAMSWLSARELRGRGLAQSAPARRWLAGARIALPLALFCAAAAAVARLDEPVHVSVAPASAAGMAALWGSLFGGLGGLLSGRSGFSGTTPQDDTTQDPRTGATASGPREGVRAGLTMLAIALGGGGLAASTWGMSRLFGGLGRGGLTTGDVLAGSVALLAFLPNLALAAVGLSLGAPIEMGAFVSVGDAVRGASQSIGLLPPTAARWYLWPLLMIPAGACFTGGARARRRSAPRASSISVLAPAALVFAGALTALAALAGLRLSGLTGTTHARLAPHVALTGGLALLWAVAFGLLGWMRAAPSVSSGPEVSG